MEHEARRITIRLPVALVAALDTALAGAAHGRGALAAWAGVIRRALAAIENAEMDAVFATMATDEEHQAEVPQIFVEFERAGCGALQIPTPP